MGGLSTLAIEDYAIVVVFGLFLLRRAYRLTQGVPATTARFVVLPAIYVLLYAAELLTIAVGGLGTDRALATEIGLGADAVGLALGGILAYGYTLRHVHFYQPDGASGWYFRLPATLMIVYVALFFVRVGIETAVLGVTPFEFPSPSQLQAIPALTYYLLLAVDALWGGTTGLLVGRSAAAYRAWRTAAAQPSRPAPLS